MTGNVVNLNKARKARAKMDKKSKAASNSVKFGRTNSEKLSDTSKTKKEVAFLDGHKKET